MGSVATEAKVALLEVQCLPVVLALEARAEMLAAAVPEGQGGPRAAPAVTARPATAPLALSAPAVMEEPEARAVARALFVVVKAVPAVTVERATAEALVEPAAMAAAHPAKAALVAKVAMVERESGQPMAAQAAVAGRGAVGRLAEQVERAAPGEALTWWGMAVLEDPEATEATLPSTVTVAMAAMAEMVDRAAL